MSIRPTWHAAGDAVGVLLAAGAGRRMGGPKALVIGEGGDPWLARGVRALREGGCERIVVVLGAAPEAESLIPSELRSCVTVANADDWARGQSASLRAGIRAVQALHAEPGLSALVSLVDLPGMRVAAVQRILADACDPARPRPASALVQASYDGRPGHPVFIGAAHLSPLLDHLHGDIGARNYLREHEARMVDCTDLGGGDDVDTLG